ncbi:hypothetical protein KEU06_28345 [Pseudaminobacter sp. 19-2017]|uniref:Uncharacterized protein n=1 Tax=Pseudaminobacter soli (ex Zhang et al. 2022) TaxID=2831468 RepID=A0A942E3K4_9HYPH|nr:hypothetical protein [Pseudaminobacter soli]MBS3652498.1 hypothetical protein [Pseudaminobacter soli]
MQQFARAGNVGVENSHTLEILLKSCRLIDVSEPGSRGLIVLPQRIFENVG